MKEVKWFIVGVLAVFALGCTGAHIDVCRFFPNNTLVRDPDSCNGYYECIDFVGHYHACESSKPFFDKSTGACVKSLKDVSNCELSCAGHVAGFIADPKSCFGYYYCMDEETPLWGQCPDAMHFNATDETCIHSYTSDCGLHKLDFCSIVNDGVNFNDESNCYKYYTCKKGVLTNDACKDQYYDPVSGVCKAKSLVQCAAHPYPADVCGTASKPTAKEAVPDGATCRAYFVCGKKYNPTPLWYQCPENQFFDATSQTCVKPTEVVCKWDRCDGRTLQFVTSGDFGCRAYLQCVNGVTYATGSCGNYFFDEDKGICVSSVIKYKSCTTK